MTFPADFLRANAVVLTLSLFTCGILLLAMEPWPVRAFGVVLLVGGLLMPFLRLGFRADLSRRPGSSPSTFDMPLADLNLTRQTLNVLADQRIVNVGDLLARDPDDLLDMPGIGRARLVGIREALVRHGILPAEAEERAAVGEHDDGATTVEQVVKWLREQPVVADRS